MECNWVLLAIGHGLEIACIFLFGTNMLCIDVVPDRIREARNGEDSNVWRFVCLGENGALENENSVVGARFNGICC